MPGLDGLAALRRSLPDRLAPVADGRMLGLAVSGGADSLALMLLVAEWARQLASPPRLVVYTVDHGLRPEAAAEAALVVREAGRLGLPARSLRWDGEKPSAGIQAAARAARYRLIGAAMRADGASVLLTAHHRTDQAETVLMRLAHGSGLDGLRGMAASSDVEGVPLFRPLLDVSAAHLREVVEAAGLTPVADPGNADRHYERVRWRQALPGLAELGLTEARVVQFAQRAGAAEDALGQWADAQIAALAGIDPLGAVRLPYAELMALPRAVGVRVVSRLLHFAGGGRNPRALGMPERVHARLAATGGGRGLTALGVAITCRNGQVWFTREPGRQAEAGVVVAPRGRVLWDGRFLIVNDSRRVSLEVGAAHGLSRAGAERLVGAAVDAPAAAIRSAPLVKGADGALLALGCHRLASGVAVELSGADALLPQT